MVAASLEGGIGIVRTGSARVGRQPDVLGALEVSSFAFIHSNQQRCERDRTIFVMVGPNFQTTHARWSGTPKAAVVDSEVPLGATCSHPRPRSAQQRTRSSVLKFAMAECLLAVP